MKGQTSEARTILMDKRMMLDMQKKKQVHLQDADKDIEFVSTKCATSSKVYRGELVDACDLKLVVSVLIISH